MEINILDITVYAIILISVAAGVYQGFLATSANTAGYFIALISAWLFYGGAAANVKAAGKIIPALLYYSESSDMLGTVDTYRTSVEGITKSGLDSLLKALPLPHPVDQWFSGNVLNQVYEKMGIQNLGDYLSRTVAEVAVNIGCFLMIFLGVYIALTILVNLLHYVVKLPSLQQLDGVAGGVIGLGRGVLLVFVLFLIVPVMLSMLPVQQIKEIVETSHTAAFFYQHNFLFGWIRSFIG